MLFCDKYFTYYLVGNGNNEKHNYIDKSSKTYRTETGIVNNRKFRLRNPLNIHKALSTFTLQPGILA